MKTNQHTLLILKRINCFFTIYKTKFYNILSRCFLLKRHSVQQFS